MLNKNEIKKDLYKTKTLAYFNYYKYGSLYYTIEILNSLYIFPISTIDMNYENEEEKITLSSDLGITSFNHEIRGSELIRWIIKAIDENKLIKIS